MMHTPGRLLGGLMYGVVIKQVRQTHLRVANTSAERHVSGDVDALSLVQTTAHVARQHRPVAAAPVWKSTKYHSCVIVQRNL